MYKTPDILGPLKLEPHPLGCDCNDLGIYLVFKVGTMHWGPGTTPDVVDLFNLELSPLSGGVYCTKCGIPWVLKSKIWEY